MNKRKTLVAFFLTSASLLILFLTACTKADTDKNTQPPPAGGERPSKDSTFTNEAAAISAMASIYTGMVDPQNFTSGSAASLSVLCGLYADELNNYSSSADQKAFYENSLTPNNSLVENSIWRPAYRFIDSANKLIEKLSVSNNVSSLTKQYLTGEAKFIRAFCHFYLVNLFGDVPYITTTDTNVIKTSSRRPTAEVYQKIIIDLKDAAGLLSDLYMDANLVNATTERIRPNKWAAIAMLARVYLYTGDWVNAEIEATKVIQNNSLYALDQVNNVFLKNSKEAIWQIKPPNGMNTYEANVFILTSQSSSNVAMSPWLRNAFGGTDLRKTAWKAFVGIESDPWNYPYKYKVKNSSVTTEYSMVLRLAEQYLIRAEARIQQDKLTEGKSDIGIIRARAGLPNTDETTREYLLNAVDYERRVELFTEWGHRWLDLKRRQQTDVVLQLIKNPFWSAMDHLFPIPASVINSNVYMQQNPGY